MKKIIFAMTFPLVMNSISYASSTNATKQELKQTLLQMHHSVVDVELKLERFTPLMKEEIGNIDGQISGQINGQMSYNSPLSKAFKALMAPAIGALLGGGAGLFSGVAIGGGMISVTPTVLGAAGGTLAGGAVDQNSTPDAQGQINGSIDGSISGKSYQINNSESVYALNVVSDDAAQEAERALTYGDLKKQTNACFKHASQYLIAATQLPNTISVSQLKELSDSVTVLRKNILLAKYLMTNLLTDKTNASVLQNVAVQIDKTENWLNTRRLIIHRIKYRPQKDATPCGLKSGEVRTYKVLQQIDTRILGQRNFHYCTRSEYGIKACMEVLNKLEAEGLAIHLEGRTFENNEATAQYWQNYFKANAKKLSYAEYNTLLVASLAQRIKPTMDAKTAAIATVESMSTLEAHYLTRIKP